MKTYIVLTSDFYVDRDANGICIKNVIDELKNRGNHVYVICNGEKTEVVQKDVVCVKKNIFSKFDSECSSIISKILYNLMLWVRRIFLAIISLVSYPNVSFLRTRSVYKELCKLYNMVDADCVVGVFRPYENIEALSMFKKVHKNVSTVAVYFDLPKCNSNFGNAINEYLDWLWLCANRRTFSINDYIMFPQNVKMKYDEEYSSESDKFIYFDFPMFVQRPIKEHTSSAECFNIVYAGSIDGVNRSAMYFLQLIDILRQSDELNINVYFYGNITEEKILNKYKCCSYVKFMGKIDSSEVFDKLCSADCLLNVSNRITYDMIPSKIFQMFSSCRKIINIISNKNDFSICYFEKYPAVLNIEEYNKNIDKDVMALKDFINTDFTDELRFNYVRDTYIKNTPESFVDSLINCQ